MAHRKSTSLPAPRSRPAGRVDRLLGQPQKSLSEIYLPAVSDNPKTAEGYQGEDAFSVVENKLVQRFPVYDSADANAGRTGKMRQIEYKLMAGEAGWVMREDKVSEQ